LENFSKLAEKGLWGEKQIPLEVGTDELTETPEETPSSIQTNSPSSTVFITNTGKKYHKGNCRYLKKSKIPISLNDARNQRYSPCSVCDP